MGFLRRSLAGLLLLVVTLALLGLAGILIGNAMRQSLAPGRPALVAEERVVAANLLTVTASDVTPSVVAYGKVVAARTLALRLRQGGTVVWVSKNLRSGGQVAEGEVLLRLDPVPAEDALALAGADLAEAEAAATEALATVELAVEDLAAAQVQADLRQQALDRQKDIAARGAGSDQAVETTELALSAATQAVLSRKQALASARARVDQTAVTVTRAKIALAEAERALAETSLHAGLSGRIDGVALVTGAVVAANEALGQIIDTGSLEIALRLSTAQYARLLDEAGALRPSAILVTLPGLAEAAPLRGRLDRSGAAVGEGQSGRLVFAALEAAPEGLALLKPGDFVEVAIEGTTLADAAIVPATAVGRQATVLVLGSGDRLEEVAVTVLGRQGDAVIIAVGALDGREIVAERSAFLGGGIRIRPIRPGSAEDDKAAVPPKLSDG